MDGEKMNSKKHGVAYLVGAGSGDPGLLTLRAKELLERADLVIYDYLCNPRILQWVPVTAEKIYAGKKAKDHTLTQDQINLKLVEMVRAGKTVVRLKGGDPFVFGRGGEEAQSLRAEGLDFEIVPGITSGVAAPAYAGIPVTHRDFSSSVTFITGHEDPTKPDSALDWKTLGALKGTRVFFMGVERLGQISSQLIAHGTPATMPAALIRWGTWPKQESLVSTVGLIAEEATKKGFQAPAIFIVGDVVSLKEELTWFENRPLHGQRIVVTRSRTQVSKLATMLLDLGADVLEIPTIRVEPRGIDSAVKEKLQRFQEEVDLLILTSPNAVDCFFGTFLKIHGDVRKLGAVKIASVGTGTTKSIEAYHVKVDFQPTEFTAEELASQIPVEMVQGKRVCLPRSSIGNPELSKVLIEKGGDLWEWPIYDTVPETEDPFGNRQRFIEEGADWVLFSSSSTVEYWHPLQIQTAGKKPRFGSMGPVTTAKMQELGYEIGFEAAPHTIPGFVESLIREVEKTKK
jgi:uroporphyrinogen III methyltransferase/synthase